MNKWTRARLEKADDFNYRMLGRLKFDMDNFLAVEGFSYGKEKSLWALNLTEQIKEMKKIYTAISIKPEWLNYDDIIAYSKKASEILLKINGEKNVQL